MIRQMIVAGLIGLLSACGTYTEQAQAWAEGATASTIAAREKQESLKAGVFAKLYCDDITTGAVARRYQNPEDLLAREMACQMERRLGWGR